ncbi:MAG: hypothetical protein OEY22_11050 [Candidatus Bathyarchaeota archaeon]|nr:hypothetical protein [Candidatus Bathyarchaeota archaeon]MDH5786664.1 hypothetical protein [Candidatus Bathyarchaeota archaeon]
MVRQETARTRPIKTKKGIIIYHAGKNDFKIHLPTEDEEYWYGGITAEKLCKFFKALAEGKTIAEAQDSSFRSRE